MDSSSNTNHSENPSKSTLKIKLTRCSVNAKPAPTSTAKSSAPMNLYGRGRALRSRMIDTAAGSISDEDSNDDNTDGDKADTDRSSPPEKRRRSEPTSRTSRSSNAGRSGELRSSGRAKHRASDGNLPVDEQKKRQDTQPDLESSLKQCQDFVSELMERSESWPFRRAVSRKEPDELKRRLHGTGTNFSPLEMRTVQAPGYTDVIRHPMDLSKVQSKLSDDQYSTVGEFVSDVRLIFTNCSVYYSMPTSPQRLAGVKLSRHFERRLKELHLLPSSAASKSSRSSAR